MSVSNAAVNPTSGKQERKPPWNPEENWHRSLTPKEIERQHKEVRRLLGPPANQAPAVTGKPTRKSAKRRQLENILRKYGCQSCGAKVDLALVTSGGKQVHPTMAPQLLHQEIRAGTYLVRCGKHRPGSQAS